MTLNRVAVVFPVSGPLGHHSYSWTAGASLLLLFYFESNSYFSASQVAWLEWACNPSTWEMARGSLEV